MSSRSDVKLVLTADGRELRKEIDADIRALSAFGKVVEKTNATAVSAFRSSAAAQREHMTEIGATAQQMNRLDATTRKFEKDVAKASAQQEQMNPKLRSGASAMTMLAYAASGAGGSVQGVTIAMGTMAESIAAVSKNARLAASASGIGAMFVGLGMLIGLLMRAKEASKQFNEGIVSDFGAKRIENIRDIALAERELARARREAAQATANVSTLGKTGSGELFDKSGLQAQADALAKVRLLQERVNELRIEGSKRAREADAEAAEAQRAAYAEQMAALRDLAIAAGALATERHREIELGETRLRGDVTAFQLQARQAELMSEADDARVRAMFEMQGLTEAHRQQMEGLLTQNQWLLGLKLKQIEADRAAVNARAAIDVAVGSDDAVRAHEGRLAMIEAERQAAIQAGIDVATANESAEQKKAALRRSMYEETINATKQLSDALISSRSRELREFGKIVRLAHKVEMGVVAGRNTIAALEEAARAIGLASRGRFGAAALAGLASVKHAATAAAAGASMGGGGGGGGSSGGGGADSSRAGASLAGGGSQRTEPLRIEIVYVEKALSGQEVRRVRQEIQRLDDRSQPIRMGV